MPLPLGANTVDAAALADELARFRVVGADRLALLLAEFTGGRAADLADFLVRRGALTAFQAERALAGEARVLALGPYRLTGGPERGTFGPMFTAAHTSKPGPFSVCVLPLRSLWRARQAKQLARTLSAVTHPTVAPLLDVDSANGLHYLVWAAAAIERLADRVETSGPLPAGEAAAALGHLANALTACHTRGAVHGALTPRSVALAPDGLPRLLELGAGTLLAQNLADDESLFDSMSVATASADVLACAAPELAAEPSAPTPATDQYALGAVGYFAVTGLPPYPHPALTDQLRAKRAGPPPSAAIVNPDVPAALAAVFERMMAPAPAARFATLHEVEVRLAELATAGPDPPAEPSAVESLLLSKLRAVRDRSGAISWSGTGSRTGRLPERDESDASVTFDLPEVPEALAHVRASDPDPGGAEAPRARPAPQPVPSAHTPDPTDDMGRRRGAVGPDATGLPGDPRLSAPAPVRWHTADGSDEPGGAAKSAPPPRSVVWEKMKRNLLFWQAASDTVQASVFGPPAVTPGQTTRLTVFLHPPGAADSVRTLSRAFQHDAELIGTGYLTREVQRTAEIAVHLSVANAGVAKTLLKCQWRGQPHRLGFDLHVPWESPEGASPGLVSVGLNGVRIGQIEFQFHVLPRKA